MNIRPYERADRDTVREICFKTGWMGDPIELHWRDADSWADMFTSYYTDLEPESALVAEVRGVVVGYLLGCLDARRAWNPAAVALRHVVRRGIAFRPGTARFVWRSVWDAFSDLLMRRTALREFEFSDRRWPAHFHIDLLPAARGLGIGHELIIAWLANLASEHIDGCYLETFLENEPAISLFEACGFRCVGRPVFVQGFRSYDGGRLHQQVMVRP